MQNKKQIIKELLEHLYFLENTEVEQILSRLNNLPEEALRQIISVLKNAQKKQNEMFGKLNKIDPDFNNGLNESLKKEFSKISAQVESQDRKDAEKFLENL